MCSPRSVAAARRHHPPPRPTPAASERLKKPLVLIGFMGCGKSVVGNLVAQRAGAPFRDLDLIIERVAGTTIADLFARGGEPEFRALESRLLPGVLEPGAVVAVGGGAPFDDGNWSLITSKAVTVFIDCPFETMWQRTSGTSTRPLAAGRSREELETLLEQRLVRYRQAVHHVDGNRPAELVADDILKLWSD